MTNKQSIKKIQFQEFTNQIDDKNEKDEYKDFKENDILYLLQKQIIELNEKKKRQTDKKKSVSLTQWENYQEYLLFFENISIFGSRLLDVLNDQQQHQKIMLQFQQQLKKNNFSMIETKIKKNSNQTKNQSKIEIEIIKKSKNYEVVEIMCSLDQYAKIYTILNQTKQSHRHKNKVIGIGSFGKVFLCQHKQIQSAVKCLRFTLQSINQLKNHIKQYFLYDMMSSLQIGPKILRISGFDFILFKDCMQFQMEKCQRKADEEIQTQLKQELIKMHLLSIVHCDIKPANIVYSKQFKKNVFLDFGTSEIINEEFGQKTLAKFRGTYQFCGKQMKKLFLSQKISNVDLYINDVEMLTNSLCCRKNICGEPINLLKNEVKYFQKYGNFNSSKQLQFSFKYYLYANQYSQRPSDLFLQFLAQFQQDINYKDNIPIILSAIKFTSEIGELALLNLKKHRIWKIAKYKQIQFIMNDPQLFQSDNSLQIDWKSFENLYNLLIIKNENENHQNAAQIDLQQVLGIIQNKNIYRGQLQQKQNENNKHFCQNQIIKLNCCQCDIFQSFLQNCSFLGSQFRYSIEKKEYLSKLLLKLINSFTKQTLTFSIVKDQMLPISKFANTQCKNLVQVYKYLLNYCYEKYEKQFALNNTCLIIKDCVILGFQYFYFIQELLVKYFSELINLRSINLITTIAQKTQQFILLTQHNFILTKLKKPLYQKKHFRLCLKNILLKLVKHLDQSVSQSQSYYSKRKPLELFWEAFFSQQKRKIRNSNTLKEQVKQKVTIVINQIQKQISHQTISRFGHLIMFLIRQSQKIIFQNIEIKTPLLKHIDQRKLQKFVSFPWICVGIPGQLKVGKQTQLALFDYRINCYQLSQMFYVNQRLQFYSQNSNFDNMYQIWNLFLEYQGCPSINYHLTRQRLNQNILDFQKYSPQMHEKIVQKMSNSNVSLLKIFEQTKNQDSIIKVLLVLNGLYSCNGDFLLKQKPVLYQKLNKFKKKYSQQSIVYLIIKKIQLQLFPNQSIEYIKKQKQFFQLCLQNHRKINCFMKDEEEKNMAEAFFNLTLFSHSFFDQQLKYWENYRIKIILRKPEFLTTQFQQLYTIFIMTNNSKYLIEILCYYCKQINSRVNYSYYTMMNKTILQWIPIKRLKIELYNNFLEILIIIKKQNPYPIYLIPIYIFILGFVKQLSIPYKKWRCFLIQLINLTQKISKSAKKVHQNIQTIAYTFLEQLDLLSLQYFQKKIKAQHNQNSQFTIQTNKKYKILLKKLLKHKTNSFFFYQKQIEHQIKKLEQINFNRIGEINLAYQKKCVKNKAIQNLFLQKFKRYKQSCLHNITFNNYQQDYLNNIIQKYKNDSQKRILYEILHNSQQKMIKFGQLVYSTESQFLKKYKIRIKFFLQSKPIISFYTWSTMKKQFLNMPQKQYSDRIKLMENQIEKIKKTTGQKLSKQTVDIIDQILDSERKILLEQLQQKFNLQQKDIQGKWVQSFL